MTRRHVEEETESTGSARSSDSTDTTRVDRTAQAKAVADQVRARLAQLVWIVCALAALVLAVAALCIALKANLDNSLVKFCIDTSDKLDFGVFSRADGVAHWTGHSHASVTKNALVNWGLAAVVWLIIGRIVERIIRPSSRRVS